MCQHTCILSSATSLLAYNLPHYALKVAIHLFDNKACYHHNAIDLYPG